LVGYLKKFTVYPKIGNMKVLFKIPLTLAFLCILHNAKAWEGNIVFQDNFDGNSLDLNKWEYQEGCGNGKFKHNINAS